MKTLTSAVLSVSFSVTFIFRALSWDDQYIFDNSWMTMVSDHEMVTVAALPRWLDGTIQASK